MYRFPYHYIVQFDLDGYGSFSQHMNNPGGFRRAGYLIRAFEKIDSLEFDSLIDIGCGDGYFLNMLSKKYPSKQLVGVDICAQAIEFAKLLGSGDGIVEKNTEFLFRDIVKEPLDRQFDLATSVAVLEHIPPDFLKDFLAATSNLIKNGGRFIALVPSSRKAVKSRRHYQHFDEQSLGELLSEHFEVECVEYLNNDFFWGQIISLLLSNKLFILNSRSIREWLFKLYVRWFLRCSQSNGYMFLVVCKKL